MKLRYRQLRIIKHALQHYIKRDNTSDSDIERESNLLKKIINEIEKLEKGAR